MRASTLSVATLLFGLGCEASPPAAPSPATEAKEVAAVQAAAPAPTSQPAPSAQGAAQGTAQGERSFGAPLSSDGDPIALADILSDPKPYLGKSVKTSGVVARVCERAGCWLELKPEAGEGGLRVPMANHAFMIPQDAVGRPAIVEGELSAQALSPSHKEHLEGEGAQAVGPLALSARAVLVR